MRILGSQLALLEPPPGSHPRSYGKGELSTSGTTVAFPRMNLAMTTSGPTGRETAGPADATQAIKSHFINNDRPQMSRDRLPKIFIVPAPFWPVSASIRRRRMGAGAEHQEGCSSTSAAPKHQSRQFRAMKCSN